MGLRVYACMCTCVCVCVYVCGIHCFITPDILRIHFTPPLHHSLAHSLAVVSQEMFANLSTYGIDLQQPSEQDLANLDWLREVRE